MSVGVIKNNNVSSEIRAIRLAREKLGITRNQLAESLGISYKAVEKIEHGLI
jgi:DNA-binding XRE family transcriptional regulator